MVRTLHIIWTQRLYELNRIELVNAYGGWEVRLGDIKLATIIRNTEIRRIRTHGADYASRSSPTPYIPNGDNGLSPHGRIRQL